MLTRRRLLASTLAPAVLRGTPARPNIVLLMADDLGYGDLGVTGSAEVKTPHIDSLAKNGSRFTNWYSAAPLCAPARAALLTGRYPQRCGVPDNGRPLPQSEIPLPRLFQGAGYRTALIGKWHLGATPGFAPNDRGFDEFYGFHSGCVDFFSHRFYWGEPNNVNYHDLYRNREEIFEDGSYLTENLGRESVRFIDSNRAQPFLLVGTFNAPHYPMHAPVKYTQRFMSLPLEQRIRAAMISALDDQVGLILQALRDRKLLDNTLVAFTSDNGATREPRAGLGGKPPVAGTNQPWRGHKFSLFDGGMHVPMLMQWPSRLRAGQVNSGLASHLDLLSTFCAASGIAEPRDRTMDGFNLLEMVSRSAPSPRREIFWESGKQAAVRTADWKFVRDGSDFDYATGKGYVPLTGADAEFLSRPEDDPGERRNLRAEQPAQLTRMKESWTQWRAAVQQP